MNRNRLVQLAFVAVAAAAFVCAALLSGPIESERERLKMVSVMGSEAVAKYPKIALLQVAPGGLRAPFFNYLWIRSQSLKEQGKFFDAQALRNLICELMPRFSGVWAYHAWDMAWNISVATHTPEERWMWVYNGVKLIRDKGLAYNPDDLILYKELSWIFFSKMGLYIDEMHRVYKQRWAEEMDWVLGSPPPGTTADVINAFRPVAGAPATLKALRADEPARALLAELAGLEVPCGGPLLRYYNRFSKDPRRAQLLTLDAEPADEREQRIAALIASPKHAAALGKLLAFARRKVLTEQYHMDVEWMLKLMERYGPLDWRNVNAHAIYWATLGLVRAGGTQLEAISPALAEARVKELKTESLDLYEFTRLSTERTILGALKTLTWCGQLDVRRGRPPKREPLLMWQPDWRFIAPAHREYVAGGKALSKLTGRLDIQTNTLRDGHITFLEDVVLTLYFGGRGKEAQEYFDELKKRLKPTTELYKDDPNVQDWLRKKTAAMETPPAEMARVFWTGGLRIAYRSLAAGDRTAYAHYHNFAQRAYWAFINDVGKTPRLRPPPFPVIEQAFLTNLMASPQAYGVKLSLMAKSKLYSMLALWKQQVVYPSIANRLREQCAKEGIDFDKAFPAPPRPRRSATPDQQP